MYLQLDSRDISLLKFFLEANDNLAYLTTLSPHTAVAKLVFAPEQEQEVREFLITVQSEIALREVLMGRVAERR